MSIIKARSVTAFLHAQSSAVAMLAVACLCALSAWQWGTVTPDRADVGVCLPSANLWIPFGEASAIANIAANAAVAILIIYINRAFNILRSLTALVATMFLAMQIAVPSELARFNDGTVLAIVMLVCSMLLFSVFDNPEGQRRVFLVFCIIGAVAFSRAAYLFFVPVLLLGCAQMRVLSLRGFLAALLGLITPAWIIFGFGIVDPRLIHVRELVGEWALPGSRAMVRIMVVAVFTILTGTFFTVANILKILSYNSRVRAFNGFFTMLFMFTAVLSAVNFSNLAFYLPLLNCMAAYQVGHFFTYRRHRNSFIPILAIILVYFGFYIWAMAA